MFPSFVSSFGDQLTAVVINLIGTITGSFFNGFVSALVSTFVTPLLNNIADVLGVG